ncbi:MAG: PAS domain S-box protein [Devosia sp.]|nr:PAS domain S-box protein [Devosia sp.]
MPKSLFPQAPAPVRAQLERDATVKLLNDFDWAANPLGAIPGWPESLKGAVRLVMVASTPMVMLVGPDGILIYNDAYARFAGQRHPAIFGMPALQAWPEIADFNRVNIERGLRGESYALRDQELVLNRHGQLESGWMDLHYSPIVGDDGRSMGCLCVVHETTDRVLAEKALARSEERLTLALSSSALVGTWDWNVIDNIVTADDQFAQMYNIDSQRAGLGVPLEHYFRAIEKEDLPRVEREMRRAVEEVSDFRCEYRVVGPDGSRRWLMSSGRPRLDAQGRVYRFPGVAIDITDSRRAAEERELVAQELSHRIKNIFAVLIGIVSLSARGRPDIKEFAEQLRRRIFALGEAHDFARPHSHLIGAPAGQGSLSALVARLMRPYEGDNGAARVIFSGDDTAIDDAAATPLALLFHELATNAAKYGSLSQADGTVELVGRVDGDNYRLVWKECGGPRLAEPTHLSGFGSRLIGLSVEGQMRGEIERHWLPEGLSVELSIPLESLNRSSRLRARSHTTSEPA